MFHRISRSRRRPSSALLIAVAALFLALTGGAVAAGVVPLAKHAYTADSATVARNAKHLGGKTAAEIAASMRGPQGIQGTAGPTGPAGAAGAAGPKGDTGATGAAGAVGPKGDQGPKGDKGDVGTGLKIVGTVATQQDLPDSGTTGDGYLVAGDLYVWTGSVWTNAGPVLGPKGDTGATGATGPQGPQGPQGPKGDPGGVNGYVVVVTNPLPLDPNTEDTGTATCPTGKVAVGGGVKVADPTELYLIESYPNADGSGWNGTAAAFVSSTFTVYAVCVSSA
jgi:Collagen triple helix repeat (20 copies)